MHRTRRTVPALALVLGALAACGGDDDDSAATTDAATAPPSAAATTTPASAAATTASGDGFCADLEALLSTSDDLAAAFVATNGPLVGELLGELPDLVAAARASAPDDIAAEVDTAASALDDAVAAFEGVDFEDPAQIQAALGQLTSDPVAAAAGAAVEAYGAETCGIERAEESGEDPLADAPEPPECDVLDPSVAAAAAGLDVDVSDSDGGGDINLPGFATKSCSYGNGALTLSTLSFNDLDSLLDDFVTNTESAGGTVLDVALAGLPASSLVTEVDGVVTVAVFEAEVPFTVAVPDGDPALVVAAAGALLDVQR